MFVLAKELQQEGFYGFIKSIKMAKELPYFKFEPNQWENGNIQICTREDKGLFIDLCSMYWSRLGNLPFKLAIQKLCAGNANAFDSLIEEKLFTIINNDVCIDFLNEQLCEFEDTSEQNRKNALLGWEKRRKAKECDRNATASNPQSEINAIREEEIKKNNSLSLEQMFTGDNEKYLKFTQRFYEVLKDLKKCKPNEKITKAKVDHIRLLVSQDGYEWDKIVNVAKHYLDNMDKEFSPQAYGTQAFRKKYIQIKEFCKRTS